jgi:hypothetical protein
MADEIMPTLGCFVYVARGNFNTELGRYRDAADDYTEAARRGFDGESTYISRISRDKESLSTFPCRGNQLPAASTSSVTWL